MSSHRIRGRQLSVDSEHRIAIRRNLVQSLFEHGKIRTTLPKAQEVKGMAEKLITLARRKDLNARRKVIAVMQNRRLVEEEQEFTGETVVSKLFDEIAPKFDGREGGYTRIIKLPDYRIGDAASLVILQLADETAAPRAGARRSAGLRRKRNERKHQFASRALKKTRSESASAAESATQTPAAGATATETPAAE
jgi:large subunit ribosomal protein L17